MLGTCDEITNDDNLAATRSVWCCMSARHKARLNTVRRSRG